MCRATLDAAPGEAPGRSRLESAMDELAEACGVGPDRPAGPQRAPTVEPEGGRPSAAATSWPACTGRDPFRLGRPRPATWSAPRRALADREPAWPPSTYPARNMPSTASVAVEAGRFVVRVTAADIGTGARTTLSPGGHGRTRSAPGTG